MNDHSCSFEPGTIASMRVAHQGAPGSFSSQAARRMHPDAELVSVPAFEDVFAAVETGQVQLGVVPIENSAAGSVHENLDLLSRYELAASSQLTLPVSHSLMALPGQGIADLTQVRSHPQALAQCAEYLSRHNLQPVAWTNTADAARDLDDTGIGVLASADAAALYGLEVLATDCQSRMDNATSFLVLQKQMPQSGQRALIEFTCVNGPGRLMACLQVFADLEFNLSRLESRPLTGNPWQYRFYVEVEERVFTLTRNLMDEALDELREVAVSARLLGLY